MSKSQLAQIDINAVTAKRAGLQCDLDTVEGFTKFNVLQQRQLSVLEDLIQKQETDREAGKDFYHELKYDSGFSQMMTFAWRLAKDEKAYYADANQRFFDSVQTTLEKAREPLE